MSNRGKKDELKKEKILSNIIESISSLNHDFLIRCESSPLFPLENFSISKRFDGNLFQENIEYKIGNYLIKKTLGKGTFGKVKLGIYLPTKEKVAIKIFEKARIIENDDEIRLKREFEMLSSFNHPNIIHVSEIFESSDCFYSVMEYCEGGELFNYIVKNRRLSDEESSFFYYQLINGLEYIHSLGIVHRDLKPENLLLTTGNLLKIIDFGLSNYFKNDLLSTPCGSPSYASPEMIEGKEYNGFKIDIWSSGIILYAMLCGFLPFEDKDNDALYEKILENKLLFPKYISKEPKDLLEKILVKDPNKRISISKIKNHPFYLKGKEIFEQEFNIYQVTKDFLNNKASFIENICIPKIFNKCNFNENTYKKEKKKIIEDNLIKKIVIYQNKVDKKKEKHDINNQRKVKINNLKVKEVEDEKETKSIKEEIKPIIGRKQTKIKKKKIIETNNYSIKNEKHNYKIFELNKENSVINLKIDYHKKSKCLFTNNLKEKNNENNLKIQINDNIKLNKINRNYNIKNKLKKRNTNISIKEKEISQNKDKNRTIIRNNKNKFRKKLIKSEQKSNLKINAYTFNSCKKPDYNVFKNRIQIKKNYQSLLKHDNHNLINERIINIKIFKNKLNIKEKLNRRKLIHKGKLYDKKINNITNNTIDIVDIPKKLKVCYNFHKFIKCSKIDTKRTKSEEKQNMELNSFEISKIKINENNKNILDDNKSSKNKQNSNNKKKYEKYKELHKNNLKNVNSVFKKNNYNNKTNTLLLVEENKKKIIKAEKRIEKQKTLLKINKINIRNIYTDNINNIKKNIIENNKNIEDKLKNNIEKEKTRYYNIKTNITNTNINERKISPKKFQLELKRNNKIYTMNNFDKIKNNNLWKQNLNKSIKNKTNLNIDKMIKKTIDIENNKSHIMDIDISTNIGYIKTADNSKNKNINLNRSNKKINKFTKINILGNTKKLFNKDKLNFNIELNNKKYNFKDIIIKNKKNNLNIKKSPDLNKNNLKYKIKKINIIEKICDKKGKNQLDHIKFSSQKTIKMKNQFKTYKAFILHNKTQNSLLTNFSKISNKTPNNSKFNSFIKNPFIINETNIYDNMIPISSSYTDFTSKTYNLNKNANDNINSKSSIDNEKKSFVSIKNSEVNLNLIDSQLIMRSLNRKKEAKKKYKIVGKTKSVKSFYNNHLSELCSKFNTSISIYNNNLTSNINNSNNNCIPISKKAIINIKSNNILNSNSKKILNNTENNNNNKKIINICNKKYINNKDNLLTKSTGIIFEDYHELKTHKKML